MKTQIAKPEYILSRNSLTLQLHRYVKMKVWKKNIYIYYENTNKKKAKETISIVNKVGYRMEKIEERFHNDKQNQFVKQT